MAKVRVRRDHEADYERKRKRRTLIISLALVFLMVFSVAEVIVYQQTDGPQTDYGKYSFSQVQTSGGFLWVTRMNGEDIEFTLLPTETTDLTVDPAIAPLLRASERVVLTVDPNVSLDNAGFVDYARLQFGLAMGKTIPAITTADERYTLPVLNCSVSTPQMVVVLFNESNVTAARMDGACVVLDGDAREFLYLKDRLLYEYAGIMQDGKVV